MKEIISDLRSAIVSTLVLAVVCCGLYPLVIYGIGQAAFYDKANGSILHDAKGNVIGSSLLAQGFSSDKYFIPRPSAAGTGYDATSSGGTNLGPTSKKLADAITHNVAAYRKQNGLAAEEPVPADAVTSSGSGLDPHISSKNAELQAPRVAKERKLAIEKVNELIKANTDKADLGFLGESGVNVLKLNLALDALTH
jgi:K+-transporting ATPase ATPase C chain